MKKNYYDILQVNKNASPEIIEKAYKVLAKKYHPDLQTADNKEQAEETLKLINEAYETLSDSEKKQAYDKHLNDILSSDIKSNPKEENISKKEFKDNSISNEILHEQQIMKKKQIQYEKELKKQIESARQKAYYDAYIQDLKNRGYKIKYKKSLKDYIKLLLSFIIIFFIIFLLTQIPFVKNFFINLYNENVLIKTIVDFITNFFNR